MYLFFNHKLREPEFEIEAQVFIDKSLAKLALLRSFCDEDDLKEAD